MPRTRFDLEDRLIDFAAGVCGVVDRLPRTAVGRHVGDQLVRCATSPAANYAEAQGAESRRDFVHKLEICLKEVRETRTWLKFVCRMELVELARAERVVRECEELLAIFAASVGTATKKNRRM
ncbi:MAG: four helix bundle protein [Gemmatimonadales bacterium]|nr:four helix bundle protein [Gemmatimonadales bacterium]